MSKKSSALRRIVPLVQSVHSYLNKGRKKNDADFEAMWSDAAESILNDLGAKIDLPRKP